MSLVLFLDHEGTTMAHGSMLATMDGAAGVVDALRSVHAPASYQYRLARTPLGGLSKRALDLLASVCALVCLSPVLFAVALLVRVGSSGPALYRQRRTGFRGRTFTILKFRTMRTMERGGRVVQARPNDARVTQLGGFLRRTSIDELPQLINVVMGDMSLVGPRPHALRHDHDFLLVDGHYPRRFLARPGMTGAAQIAGARGVTDTPEKVQGRLQHDLDYIDNWSFSRDVLILCSTVRVLFGDRHAC